MAIQDSLEEIKKAIKDNVPSEALVTKIEFEGSEVVLYSKNPTVLANDGENIKELARIIRKRIVIRPDATALIREEDAEEKIREIVPEDAGITEIKFEPVFSEVLIDAVKPGLVIGKGGRTLNEIKLQVGWIPKVRRTPPITSKIIKSIRHQLLTSSEDRKTILKRIGRRIHRSPRTKGGYWVRVSAMGGFREVGRSSMLLHTTESRVLIDCGINVAAGEMPENAFPYLNIPEFNLQELDAIVITHAHLDHHGFTPYLFYMGYEGPVYCTPPTRDLMFLLQWDYLDVLDREGREAPYPRKFIKKMLRHVIPLEYGEVTDISPDVRLTLHNAGHILGSSVAHLHIGDGLYNLAYTGDLKFERSRLLEPANVRFPRLETLIIEATYGGAKDIQPHRKESERYILNAINKTLKRGGKVLVPVFAVGRAQDLMVALEDFVHRGQMENHTVYLDGMIWEATGIHTTYPEYLNRDLRDLIFHKGRNPFLSDIFKKVQGTAMRQEVMDSDEPCIVLATSGMLTGGPSVEYLKNWAENPKNSLVFVGYQAEGSLGRRIQKGWKEIPMNEGGRTRMIKMNMETYTVEGFSGHSDRNQLINYIKRLNPRPERVITCHGEESKCKDLASGIYKVTRAETSAVQNLEVFRVK